MQFIKAASLGLAISGCLSGCGIQTDNSDELLSFSHGGASYDYSQDRFSAPEVTDIPDMPTSGIVTYTGEFTARLLNTAYSGGAVMVADFSSGDAVLGVAGATAGNPDLLDGRIEGNRIVRSGGIFSSFDGDFRGANGEMVTGTFTNGGKRGNYIVTQ